MIASSIFFFNFGIFKFSKNIGYNFFDFLCDQMKLLDKKMFHPSKNQFSWNFFIFDEFIHILENVLVKFEI